MHIGFSVEHQPSILRFSKKLLLRPICRKSTVIFSYFITIRKPCVKKCEQVKCPMDAGKSVFVRVWRDS